MAVSIHKSLGHKGRQYYLKKFDQSSIENILKEIDPKKEKYVLLGSGVAEKKLKIDLGNRVNIGNNQKTLSFLNKPKKLFKKLSKNGINIPNYRFNKPKVVNNWIKKNIKSSGGVLIKKVTEKSRCDNKKEYFQEFIKGKSISVQFFVKNKNISFYTVCSQWNTNSSEAPFKLGGIRTIKIKNNLQRVIFKVIKKVVSLIELNGMNSIDFIIPKDKKDGPKLIDINARPGLSINLLSKIYKKNLFRENINFSDKINIFATNIIYSKNRLIMNKRITSNLKNLRYSQNFTELPVQNDIIEKYHPVCLIHSESKTKKKYTNSMRLLSEKIFKLLN